MAHISVQLKEKDKTIAEQNETIDQLHKKIADLQRQLMERIEDSPMFKAQMESMEAYKTKVEILQRQMEELEVDNRLRKRAFEDKVELQKKYDRIKKDRDSCKKELAELRKRATHHTVIPDAPKRGAKRKADVQTRQYIHELRKIKDKRGKPVNSMQAIAEITDMSKTQVFAILKEPEYKGRWYSIINDEKVYYPNYESAAQSKTYIYFEELKEETEQ